ncbi:MAG TPA: MFS transporter [Baekduia sp.]|nr:MFS transporter [Baekduia sp.]
MRRLLLFGMALAFMETVLFTALAPLVPDLAEELDLSASQVGVLSAAYPAGMVTAAVPVGYAASRFGPRATATAGLWALAAGSLGFAFCGSPIALDLARFLQGAGSAAAWGGALTWIVGAVPAADRGAATGKMISVSFVGILLGPAIGAVAASAGRQDTFSAVGFGLVLVALWRGPHGMSAPRAERERASLRPFRQPALLICLCTLLTLGVLAGTMTALGPLLLAERGLGAGAIALCFIFAAAPSVLLTAVLGRRLSQSGLVGFCTTMLFVAGPVLPLTTVPDGRLLAATLFAVAVGLEFINFNPLMLMMSMVAERLDASQGLAMSLANGAWGLGAAAGGLCLSKLADVTSIATALSAAGAIAFITATTVALSARSGILLSEAPPTRQPAS